MFHVGSPHPRIRNLCTTPNYIQAGDFMSYAEAISWQTVGGKRRVDILRPLIMSSSKVTQKDRTVLNRGLITAHSQTIKTSTVELERYVMKVERNDHI